MRRKKVMTNNGNGARPNVRRPALRTRPLPSKTSGYVAELLVEVYALLSAAGKLTSWRPGFDIDHKDLIFDELGARLRTIYVQVKCVTQVSAEGQVRCIVRFLHGRPISNDRLVYVFALLNIKTMALEKIWLVPSRDFNRLASPVRSPGRGLILSFYGFARERKENIKPGKWDRFLVAPEDLGPRFLSVIERARATTPLRAPRLLQMVARP